MLLLHFQSSHGHKTFSHSAAAAAAIVLFIAAFFIPTPTKPSCSIVYAYSTWAQLVSVSRLGIEIATIAAQINILGFSHARAPTHESYCKGTRFLEMAEHSVLNLNASCYQISISLLCYHSRHSTFSKSLNHFFFCKS